MALARYFASDWGIDQFDECSYKPSQLMYWPTTPANGEFISKATEGEWLDPDAYLSAHPNWKDCSLLPTSSRESAVREASGKKQEDPLTKTGVIGAFCRAYGIAAVIFDDRADSEVIERLLEHLYDEGFESDISAVAEKLAAAPTIDSIEDIDSVTLSFPDTGFDEAAFERLKAICGAKASLITTAFDAISTEVNWNKEEHTIQFPWFKLDLSAKEDEKIACILFLNKLMEFAKTAKGIRIVFGCPCFYEDNLLQYCLFRVIYRSQNQARRAK